MMNLRSAIACILVISFFLLSAALLPILLRRSSLPPRKKKILIAAMIVSVLAKLALVRLEAGGDIRTWKIVADLMEQRRSIYANFPDYNSGPIWAWVLFGLNQISRLLRGDPFQNFRLALAAFLASTDVLIGLILALGYSHTSALIFLLAPFLMWIEAYQGPNINLALLVALVAWLPIRKKEPTPATVFISAVLMGLSLVIKHVVALFPIWLLFYKPLGKLRYRVGYAVVAYTLFLCSFLPWWADPASRAGIIDNVLRYNSNYGFSIIGRITELIVPLERIDAFFSWIPIMSASKVFWFVLLVVIGILAARQKMQELLLCYLLALYGFSLGLYDEYMVIPMLVCAIFHRSWASWAFMLSSFGVMTIKEVLVLEYAHGFLRDIPNLAVLGGSYEWENVIVHLGYEPMVLASQFCIVVFFILRWREDFGPGKTLRKQAMITRAASCVMIGYLPWVLRFAVHRVWAYYISQ